MAGNIRKALYNFGNGGWFRLAWTVVGMVSALVAPSFLVDDFDNGVAIGAFAFVASMFVSAGLLALRHSPIMRTSVMTLDSGWIWNAVINYVMTGIATVMVVTHEVSFRGVWAQTLIAIVVFCLTELAKPVFDFGLLQFFLRLPFQTAVVMVVRGGGSCVCVGKKGRWTVLIVPTFVLGICTLWQSVYLHSFQKRYKHISPRWDIIPPSDDEREDSTDDETEALPPRSAPRRLDASSPRV